MSMWLLALLACTGAPVDDTGPGDSGPVGGDDTGDTAGARPPCLDGDHLQVLGAHLAVMRTLGLTAGSGASATSAVAFYQLPGVDAARAMNLSLGQACAGSYALDPLTAGGVDYTITCTGEGTDWVVRAENDAADFDGWTVDRGRLDIAWTAGSVLDLAWDVRALTAPDGADFTFTGTGRIDAGLTLAQAFPSLHPDGPVTLAFADDAGELLYGEVPIATWNGAGLVDAACD